jgi:cytochrome c biogenesis protein
VVLLLVIAVASITGTIIPQNESAAAYMARFGDVGYRVLATLDVFDMYSSWWFQALLLLLVINIIVCSIERLPVTLKAVSPKRQANPSLFRNLKRKETFDSALSMDALREACRKLVGGKGGIREIPEGFYILSEKGRWTRFGVYAVHLSIVLLLVGAVVGSMFGFEGYVNIVEGESVSSVRPDNSGAIQEFGFELRCDDYDMSYYPNGTPKEYRSSMTVLEQGREVLHKDIIVNSPLRYRNINFFQSHYDLLYVELTFVSSETGTAYHKQAAIGERIELPENLGVFVLTGYQGTMDYRGRDVGPVFFGHLIPGEGEAVTVLLPVNIPELDRERKGAVVISVSGTRYYTRLQVTRDPGVWIVYSGFIMLIVGCFVTFFTSHQRLFIEAVRDGGKCRVTVAGLANKNKFGMRQEVKKIAERLGQS